MLSLVYSPTSGKFLTLCLLFDFLSFVFVLGSLLSADTTVWPSLSLTSSPHKQHRQPIAMCAALLSHKCCFCQKHSLTSPPVEVSEPELEVISSFLPLLSPKPISCPKHAVNWAPVVDMTPHSIILPNKKSKTMASAQLYDGSFLSEVSPSSMFSFCFDFSLLT